MKKNILIQIYESPVNVYFSGKKLFDRLATISASCKELSENFSDVKEEQLNKIYVDKNYNFYTSTDHKVYDILLAYIMEKPTVKLAYTMDGFTRINFNFKSEKKARQFFERANMSGAIKWVD